MKASWRRVALWGVLGAALLAGILYAFRPQPVAVDLIELARGPLVVTVDEEGETRIRDVFVISAPVSGHARRIDAEVGDQVIADQTVIAEIEPIDSVPLDPRSEAQAQADLSAAESAEALAEAGVEQARAELEFARAELDRGTRLMQENTISRRELDNFERAFKIQRAAYATAKANLQVRSFELERARAQLISPAQAMLRRSECPCLPIIAPVDGRILRIAHESEGVVSAGDPLVEIGDPSDLEIVVDLLSSDAVKVAPGQRVIIEEWGGAQSLLGRVRRVDPFGFKKVSALGIEEQRVDVTIDFESPADQWLRLGHGYQVETRIVLWEGSEVMKLPLTALFRDAERWAVFVADQDRARLRHVQVGHRTGLEAEIVDGLVPGERIVTHPSNRVYDGVLITARG